uniref:Uncharacterized protein n=1 Tax=Anguilla anguilla TaxID=7936 RepID=A0A0E9V836_ANGAN
MRKNDECRNVLGNVLTHRLQSNVIVHVNEAQVFKFSL